MAKKVISRSPGSLVAEIVIAILIIVLFLAILVPKKQWREQAREETLCRQRMENIYFASRFFNKMTHRYSTDLSELLSFAESESIEVHPPGFKLDRLTREDSGIDSFQIDYYDPYQLFSHYERAIRIDSTRVDSVVLTIKPKAEYPFAPVTQYIFTSDVPISAVNDDRGDQGVFTMIGAQGRLQGRQILGEKTKVPAARYIFNIERDDMDKCPTTNTNYNIHINVKLTIEAEMRAVLEKEAPEKPLTSSHRLSSIVVFRMLKEADAKSQRILLADKTLETVEDSLIQESNRAFLDSCADILRSEGLEQLASAIYDSTLENFVLDDGTQEARWEEIRDASYQHMNALKDDSTFQTVRDGIVDSRKKLLVTANLQNQIEKIHAEGKINVLEAGFINTTSDSAEFYSDTELIRNRLFKPHDDPVTSAKLTEPDISGLLGQFSYEETYRITKIDSTGVTIACPIEGEYNKPHPPLLYRIFKVRGARNHGHVEKGDLSWSEKR